MVRNNVNKRVELTEIKGAIIVRVRVRGKEETEGASGI